MWLLTKNTLPAFFLSLFLLQACQSQPNSDKNSSHEPKAVVKIGIAGDPSVLDPRQTRDLESVNFMHMLFEGLMRHHFDGSLIPALAEKVEVSLDQKTYTFYLRDSSWSNGDPLTAEDFVYTWKKVLDPQFPAPNAYQFFDILGAKAAKNGRGSLEDVGIFAIDPSTLVVELENPVPYFLELTAFHAFFPVNSKWDKEHPQWMNGPPEDVVSNGPFKISKWAHHNVMIVEKNPKYWDASAVNLDQIILMVLEENTALQMFERGSLDWTGSPLLIIPPDAIETLSRTGKLNFASAAGTHWFRINTEKPPFHHPKMRKAFSYALNRKAIADHILQGKQIPAITIVPPTLLENNPAYFADHDSIHAKELFQQALEEMGIIKDQLPSISFSYSNNERAHKIAQAIQQQLQKTFEIPITLESLEGKLFFEKLSQHNYQIANGSWFADFRDPINFLEVFKYKNNSTNNTQWENPEYIALLDQSSMEADPEKRKSILQKAEKLLIDEMPVIPLFYYMFNFVKKDSIKGVYFSDLGYLDFKYAYIEEDEI